MSVVKKERKPVAKKKATPKGGELPRMSHAKCRHARTGNEGKIARAKCRKARRARMMRLTAA